MSCAPRTRRASVWLPAVSLLLAFGLTSELYAQAQQPPGPPTAVRYRVDALGQVHKFVYLLRTDDGRLAAGRADLETWGLLDHAAAPAEIPGVAPSVELYWLDELTTVVVQVAADTPDLRILPAPESLSSAFRASAPPRELFTLDRGWGGDATYRAFAVASSRAAPVFDVRGNLGLTLGGLGRVTGAVSSAPGVSAAVASDGNSAPSERRLRDVRLRRDFRSGYVAYFGELAGAPSALARGLSFLGVSVGLNAIGQRRTSLSSRYLDLDDLLVLAEPGVIEVRVNGRLIATRAVGAGRLSIEDIPLDQGGNDVEVLIRHGDGRIETFERSLVGGVDLLGKGASSVGLAVGRLGRLDPERPTAPLSYDTPFATAFFGRGLTDRVTARLNAEGRLGDESHVAGRVEGAMQLPLGLIARIGGSWSHSQTQDAEVVTPGGPLRTDLPSPDFHGQGWAFDADIETGGGPLRLLLGATKADYGYLTMRQDGFARDARWLGRADLSVRGRRGNVTVRYRLREDWNAEPTHTTTAALATRLGPATTRLRVGYDGSRLGRGWNGSVGFSLGLGNFGRRASTDLYADARETRSSVTAGQSLASNARGLGWTVSGARRTANERSGALDATVNLQHRSRWFEAQTTGRWGPGGSSGSATVLGSIVAQNGRLFASSPVGSSFLVVDAGEGAEIGIFQDRRPVGTLRKGMMLLPYVSSLSSTRIAIDPASFGAGWLADRLTHDVTPAPGGVTVAFDLRRSIQAALTLLDGDGEPWPPGTEIRTAEGETIGYVGHHGQAHLTDLEGTSVLRAVAGERSCLLILELDQAESGVIRLGTVRCDG